MRKILLVDGKDLKGKISGHWYSKLPLFLKGSLCSRRRKFLYRSTGVFRRLKTRWYKLLGKEIIPTWEIVCNPTIKLSEVKARRFKMVD